MTFFAVELKSFFLFIFLGFLQMADDKIFTFFITCFQFVGLISQMKY